MSNNKVDKSFGVYLAKEVMHSIENIKNTIIEWNAKKEEREKKQLRSLKRKAKMAEYKEQIRKKSNNIFTR